MSKGSSKSVWQQIRGVLIGILVLAVLCCAGYGIYAAVDKYILTDAEEEVQEPEQEQQEEQTPEGTDGTEDGTEGQTENLTVAAFQTYADEINKLAA